MKIAVLTSTGIRKLTTLSLLTYVLGGTSAAILTVFVGKSLSLTTLADVHTDQMYQNFTSALKSGAVLMSDKTWIKDTTICYVLFPTFRRRLETRWSAAVDRWSVWQDAASGRLSLSTPNLEDLRARLT